MSSQKVRRVVHTRQTRPREFTSSTHTCERGTWLANRTGRNSRQEISTFVRIQLRIPTVVDRRDDGRRIGRFVAAVGSLRSCDSRVVSLHPRVKETVDPIMARAIRRLWPVSHPPPPPVNSVLDVTFLTSRVAEFSLRLFSVSVSRKRKSSFTLNRAGVYRDIDDRK